MTDHTESFKCLVAAAKNVTQNWEDGNLAAAVRKLNDVLEAIALQQKKPYLVRRVVFCSLYVEAQDEDQAWKLAEDVPIEDWDCSYGEYEFDALPAKED